MVNLSNITFDKGTKEAFISFVKKAATEENTAERKEVYLFLVRCFLDSDVDLDGAVDCIEFDRMIEEGVAAPRKYGLAPATHSLYKTPEERLTARNAQFKQMDSNGDGKISLDEWIAYAMKHIIAKTSNI